ncbi:Dos2-interacting transcription regulator of RNA-Pol-II-domain-containing protein [Pseudomassariella vexata]|uniref:MMS19 nucleotide excision repair protein n=1 Tax=Pseudomassariella vexata TaxID=1141098 RepID=A0A1Y2DSK1_9PEZI|nr:Dos2-interacting transcription regulator of RNA-Pol-II-domain-containing protein [Pseudomassariella vexata]ORY62242.1 Dos2-interacting transcription regulator of RNA-Pol-II-domain-containing protein [Pseudomassariella vexata]
MNTFQPSLGDGIIMNVTKLGEDFKRQTLATRLATYELILALLKDAPVAKELHFKYGETCGFMTGLLDLCRNERDPQNLLKWFEIQTVFLQNFSPSKDIAAEVFKVFSAYFPITLRASATPSGVTVDDLKGSLRSCFASHQRIADLAIPFLIEKLDQGDAVTVAVKVDILQTLQACLTQYQQAQQSVVPYTDQIWASLKYEVRNGEIRDSIESTLKVIGTLTKRLDGESLDQFFHTAWTDLADDLSNPTYTSQAGQLLTAFSGATPQAFYLSTPRALSHVKATLKQSKSTHHQLKLLSLLNSLLLVRSSYAEKDVSKPSEANTSLGLLQDVQFGDVLFEDVYAPMWREHDHSLQVSDEQVEIIKKLMGGMASLAVGHANSDAGTSRHLCSDTVREKICRWLEMPILCPLQGIKFRNGAQDQQEAELRNDATEALKEIAPLYPSGYRQLLMHFLASLTKGIEARPYTFYPTIYDVTSRLCRIGCASISEGHPLSNIVSLISTLLEGLDAMLSVAPDPVFWTVIVASIELAILESMSMLDLGQIEKSLRKENTTVSLSDGAIAWYPGFSNSVIGLPEIDIGKHGDLEVAATSLEKLNKGEANIYRQYLGYCLFTVAQIYRRVTAIKPTDSTWGIGVSTDIQEKINIPARLDQCFIHLGHMATIVIRALPAEIQKELGFWRDAFVMFRGDEKLPEGNDTLWTAVTASRPVAISSADQYRTAPLALGILSGLWPSEMLDLYPLGTMQRLCDTLGKSISPCFGDATRCALNAILACLSNKFTESNADAAQYWGKAYHTAAGSYGKVMRRAAGDGPDVTASVAIFKSVLYFLAGDIARFSSSKVSESGSNWLLRLICAGAPAEITMGRQLAQCFGILVAPKECLEPENHAILKRLRGQWVYGNTVQPHLPNCFPRPGIVDERVATNQAIATFAILRHLKYAEYQNDIEMIVRVIIRSLVTFKISQDMCSALIVLLEILAHEPEQFKEHLNTLTTHILSVYHMALMVSRSLEIAGKGEAEQAEAVTCRISVLHFLHGLPESKGLESRYLLQYQQIVTRGLAVACGDPVREVRGIAIKAKRLWLNVA